MHSTSSRLLVLVIVFVSMGCEDEKINETNNSLAESGTIHGGITFNGTWPDTGQVLLTLDTNYPPQGPPAGFEYITEESLTDGEYNYSFDNLSFRSYAAISVTYWPEGYPNGSYNSLGGNFQDMDLTQNDPVMEINFSVNFE